MVVVFLVSLNMTLKEFAGHQRKVYYFVFFSSKGVMPPKSKRKRELEASESDKRSLDEILDVLGIERPEWGDDLFIDDKDEEELKKMDGVQREVLLSGNLKRTINFVDNCLS